ncbi:hypothetical protein [Azospirillum melinis]
MSHGVALTGEEQGKADAWAKSLGEEPGRRKRHPARFPALPAA